MIKLYDAKNIHELSDAHPDELEYLTSLMQHGVSHYIDNISAEVNLLKIHETILPLLITSGNDQDSYVCSPYGHYISLGPEGLSLIKNKWLKKIANFAFQKLGNLIRRGKINAAIYINHSLFSTDLQSDSLSKHCIKEAVSFLKSKFPKHTIILRSLNLKTTPNLKMNLKACGFNFIATRYTYLTETHNPKLLHSRIIKSDLKLWNESHYDLLDHKDFTPDDEKSVLDLYTKLAINQHSQLNPKLNINFFNLIKKNPTFQIKALIKEGKIEGVAGYQIKGNVLICPIFGYDRLNQNKTQIYRLLSTLLLLEASKHAEIFHQSAGASFFKTIRCAQGELEYQAIYIEHLSIKQRMTWSFLKAIINLAAIPFMKKY